MSQEGAARSDRCFTTAAGQSVVARPNCQRKSQRARQQREAADGCFQQIVLTAKACWTLMRWDHTHEFLPDQSTATPPDPANVASKDLAYSRRQQERMSGDDVQDRMLAGTEVPLSH